LFSHLYTILFLKEKEAHQGVGKRLEHIGSEVELCQLREDANDVAQLAELVEAEVEHFETTQTLDFGRDLGQLVVARVQRHARVVLVDERRLEVHRLAIAAGTAHE